MTTCEGISRQEMMIRLAILYLRLPGDETVQAVLQPAVTGVTEMVFEAESAGDHLCGRGVIGVHALAEVDEPTVIPEVLALQFGMPVETEPAEDKTIEVPDEEIGEKETARLAVGKLRKSVHAREELIAMHAVYPFHTRLAQHRIERTARAAVGIGHEDLGIVVAVSRDRRSHGGRDALRPVVQLRGQAVNIELEPAIAVPQGRDLVSEGATGDDELAAGRGHARDVSERARRRASPRSAPWRSPRRPRHRGNRHLRRPPCRTRR